MSSRRRWDVIQIIGVNVLDDRVRCQVSNGKSLRKCITKGGGRSDVVHPLINSANLFGMFGHESVFGDEVGRVRLISLHTR